MNTRGGRDFGLSSNPRSPLPLSPRMLGQLMAAHPLAASGVMPSFWPTEYEQKWLNTTLWKSPRDESEPPLPSFPLPTVENVDRLAG